MFQKTVLTFRRKRRVKFHFIRTYDMTNILWLKWIMTYIRRKRYKQSSTNYWPVWLLQLWRFRDFLKLLMTSPGFQCKSHHRSESVWVSSKEHHRTINFRQIHMKGRNALMEILRLPVLWHILSILKVWQDKLFSI